MGIGDVLVVYPANLPRSFASVRKSNGGKKMTTENYEAFSLEVGDQIINKGNLYKIIDIVDSDNDEYIFKLVDEEGIVCKMWSESHEKWRVVIDNLAEV
jgi:hypothetical protein